MMIPMLVMGFRKGIDPFPVVAVTLAYPRKTRCRAPIPAVRRGIATACAAGAGAMPAIAWLALSFLRANPPPRTATAHAA